MCETLGCCPANKDGIDTHFELNAVRVQRGRNPFVLSMKVPSIPESTAAPSSGRRSERSSETDSEDLLALLPADEFCGLTMLDHQNTELDIAMPNEMHSGTGTIVSMDNIPGFIKDEFVRSDYATEDLLRQVSEQSAKTCLSARRGFDHLFVDVAICKVFALEDLKRIQEDKRPKGLGERLEAKMSALEQRFQMMGRSVMRRLPLVRRASV